MMRGMWAVGALAALVLSGCAGNPAPQALPGASGSEEPVSSKSVEAEPGVFVPENRGSLRGVVYNDARLPVKGARVTLLQTDHFQDTAQTGRFLFENLTAGAYRQRDVYGALVIDLARDPTYGS